MPQHTLWREDNERLADASAVGSTVHLAPQDVEILRRSGAVHHLHVVFSAKLQEALDAGAGVLRALSLVAVRQEQHQAAGLSPLRFGGGDELVDHDLRAVREIAKLRFPQDQRQRVGHTKAEFESHDRIFAEGTVPDLETFLVSRKMLEGNVEASVLAVEQFQVSLAERSAAAILATEPNRRAFEHHASESEDFTGSPVERRSVQDLLALFDEAFQLRMDVKIRRERRDSCNDLFQGGAIGGGIGARRGGGNRAHCGEFLNLVVLACTLGGIVDLVQAV